MPSKYTRTKYITTFIQILKNDVWKNDKITGLVYKSTPKEGINPQKLVCGFLQTCLWMYTELHSEESSLLCLLLILALNFSLPFLYISRGIARACLWVENCFVSAYVKPWACVFISNAHKELRAIRWMSISREIQDSRWIRVRTFESQKLFRNKIQSKFLPKPEVRKYLQRCSSGLDQATRNAKALDAMPNLLGKWIRILGHRHSSHIVRMFPHSLGTFPIF